MSVIDESDMRYDVLITSLIGSILFYIYEWTVISKSKFILLGYIACGLVSGFASFLINILLLEYIDHTLFFFIVSILYAYIMRNSRLFKKLRSSQRI